MMMSVRAPSPRLLLQHGVDRDAGVGQDAGQVGHHAELVVHVHAQVVAGRDFGHRQDGHVGHLVRLEGQVRHAAVRVGGGQAGDVDQVGDHREAVGSAPAPLP
jgi:hypothetical protein